MGYGKRLGFATKAKQHFFKSLDLQECIKPAEKRDGLFTGDVLYLARFLPSAVYTVLYTASRACGQAGRLAHSSAAKGAKVFIGRPRQSSAVTAAAVGCRSCMCMVYQREGRQHAHQKAVHTARGISSMHSSCRSASSSAAHTSNICFGCWLFLSVA